MHITYRIGDWVEAQYGDGNTWYRGVIAKADDFGYWYLVILENGKLVSDSHSIHCGISNVWHERIRSV